jgi:DHA3 family macrolide efflux protein-like MFS transporter
VVGEAETARESGRMGRRRAAELNVESAETPAPSALWANRNFVLLWSGQFVSQIGDRLAMVAFPWLVYTATGSTLSTGLVLAIYTLPYVLFGMFAGAAIDRLDKRRVMLGAELGRTVLVLLVPLAADFALWSVFILSFGVACLTVLFDPAKLSLLPDIVPKDQLLRANSLLATAETLTEVLGYASAGFLLAAVSTATAFRLDALTFVVSAFTLVMMAYTPPARAAVQQAGRSFGHELREGFAYMWRHAGLLANTLLTVVLALGVGAIYPLTFFLAVEVLDGGTRAFGVFEAAIAVGSLTGALAVAWLAKRLPLGRAILVGFTLVGAGMAALAAPEQVWVAAVVFAVVGVANAAALISIDTYVQQTVPEHIRGRVWGSRFTLTQGSYAVSVLAGGALAGVADVRVLFVVFGLLVALPALFAFFVPALRDA